MGVFFMIETTFELLEDKNVNKYTQIQLKKLQKNKNNINTKEILTKFSEEIKEIYTITRQNPDEIVLKIDKKRNVEDIKKDIQARLENLIGVDVEINLLYKILKINNELIIRTKRIV